MQTSMQSNTFVCTNKVQMRRKEKIYAGLGGGFEKIQLEFIFCGLLLNSYIRKCIQDVHTHSIWLVHILYVPPSNIQQKWKIKTSTVARKYLIR